MSTHAEARAARTESLFREVNERIAETASRFAPDDATFVCECSDVRCTHGVHATVETYEHVREDGAQFLIARGHEDERVERVVIEEGRFSIVEKLNGVGALARRLDPRAA